MQLKENSQLSILITGCSSGIGYDTAHYLHNSGYKVFATVRSQDDLLRLQNEGLTCYFLDVTKHHTITETLETILKQTNGTLDAVFNNAGYGQPGALEDISSDVLKEQFETNVIGLHELTRQVIPIMRKQGYGRILQHSSILGLISLRFRGAYNASKYAIEALCDTMRLELKDSNIYVVSLNTGPVTSDFRKNATKKFVQHVNFKNSIFSKSYEKELLDNHHDRKEKDPFTRDSIVVIKAILHVLKSNKPKTHYHITEATRILATLKRLLPKSILDKLLVKI
jgi:short-subunit dehydrogenase